MSWEREAAWGSTGGLVGACGRTVRGLYIAASVGRYCIDRKETVSPAEGYNEAGGEQCREEEAPV